jgi:hypothetical protein
MGLLAEAGVPPAERFSRLTGEPGEGSGLELSSRGLV